MATKYTMQEMPDLRGDGTHKLYPRMVIVGRRTLDDIAGEVAIGSTFSRGEIVGVITSFVQEMATQMSRGYSVSIDGLGTFTPALGLADGKEAEQVDGGKRINAQSVKVSDINFRADRAIVIDTDRRSGYGTAPPRHRPDADGQRICGHDRPRAHHCSHRAATAGLHPRHGTGIERVRSAQGLCQGQQMNPSMCRGNLPRRAAGKAHRA